MSGDEERNSTYSTNDRNILTGECIRYVYAAITLIVKGFKHQVFGWCFSKYDGWGYCFLYYRKMVSETVFSQVRFLKRLFYCAGFVHAWRGLHWRRN